MRYARKACRKAAAADEAKALKNQHGMQGYMMRRSEFMKILSSLCIHIEVDDSMVLCKFYLRIDCLSVSLLRFHQRNSLHHHLGFRGLYSLPPA